ncbi:putative ABC transport system ATP-binding protein [Aliiroseovarius sediminilitoris]|uniref:Putative ABC transport system ATP-binding protein n=1 Tax=Aliiroseovarius sediminilitoris TaxID=1173584 RepID=A0A1I0QGU3_9RHOB|nr:ABC transporter ATP-binding protein [Aliiroseovarius sediminilitoris]SEW26350.1 putative ABC transport system ATP-binding protein [Aliiroseovarius sediminilitoris]
MSSDNSNASRTPIYRMQDLTKTYRTEAVDVHALRGVTAELPAGEIVVLLGASGSGKSTLLNILGGLDTATSGKAWFRDQDLTTKSDRELTRYRRDHVGFVFQFYNLVPSLTARENVALVTEISGHPMPPEEALERVGLGHRMDHFPAEMSGGEQQRVAIARAIAKRPEVLLCDEPTGALDSKTGVQVLEALHKINTELGTSTLVITHNAGIQAMAHRVVFFADGSITEIRENADRIEPNEIVW